jgi:hypothetical protein
MLAHASALESGRNPSIDGVDWYYLNALRAPAAFPSKDAATDRLAQLARQSDRDFTRQDLHDLDALHALPEKLRPDFWSTLYAPSIAQSAEHVHDGGTFAGDGSAGMVLTDYREKLRWDDHYKTLPKPERITAYRELLARAVADSQEAVAELRVGLRFDPEHFDVAIDSAGTRSFVALDALSHQIGQPRSGPQIRAALENVLLAMDDLKHEHPTPAIQELGNDTRQLAQDGIDRIDGTYTGRRGFSNYSDFAELGNIRSNLQLIMLLHGTASATT